MPGSGSFFDPNFKHPFDPRYKPAPVPTTGAFDLPLQKLCCNAEWMSHVVGVLDRLCYTDAWIGTDLERENATYAMESIIARSTTDCTPTMCDVYGVEPPSWDTIAEDYFACYGVELTMPLEMRVSAACGLEYRQSSTGPWVTVEGAQFVPLDGDCEMDGGLKIRSDDAAKKSLDIVHPSGNTQDVTRFQAANGGYLAVDSNGVPSAINSVGEFRFGSVANQWRFVGGGSEFWFGPGSAAPWMILNRTDGLWGLFGNLAWARTLTGVGRVNVAQALATLTGSSVNYQARLTFELASWGGVRTLIRMENDGTNAKLRFFDNGTPVSRPTITGEWNGSPAGQSLAAALAALGLVTNSSTAGTLPTSTIEMQVAGGYIQWRPTSTAAWTNLITLDDLEGPQGEPGEQGLQGEPGVCDPDNCLDNDVPDNPQTGTDAGRCAIAYALGREAKAIWDKAIEDSDGAIGEYIGGVGNAAAVVAVFFPGIAVGAGVIAIFANAIGNLIGWIAENDAAAFDSEVVELVTQLAYCALGSGGELSVSELANWANDIALSGLGFGSQLEDVILSAPFEAWRWAAQSAALTNPAGCDEFQCGDGTIAFAAETSNIAEDAGVTPLLIDVVLSLEGGSLQADLTADIVLSGTAVQGTDYNVSPTSITFLAGAVDGDIQQIEFQVINDALEEGNETAILTLSNVVGGVLGAIPAHTVTIVDDEEDTSIDWCYTWDFTASANGWVSDSSAVWSVGGWQHSGAGGTNDNFKIASPAVPNYTLTKAKVELSAPVTGTNPGGFVQSKNGGARTTLQIINGSASSYEFMAFAPTSMPQTVMGVDPRFGVLSGERISARITRVTLWGTGPNPFGSDNC